MVLIDSGKICFYNLENVTGTLVKVLDPKNFKDRNGPSPFQKITSFMCSHIQPPAYDCDNLSSNDAKTVNEKK